MEVRIDELYALLDWNQSREKQEMGMELARKVKHLSVFCRPLGNKGIWENCARILAEREDHELLPYCSCLFLWLQDMNWPGAAIIFGRLQKIPVNVLELYFTDCVRKAIDLKDYEWCANLNRFLFPDLSVKMEETMLMQLQQYTEEANR